MKDFISKYSIYYPKTLIYMLQATEYNIIDYLTWYRKINNFNGVEKRKNLVKTPKAILLLIIIYSINAFLLTTVSLLLLLNFNNYQGLLSGLILLILWPYILAYLIIIPLYLSRTIIQKPLEHFIIEKARKKIEKHKGLKIAIAGSFGKTSMREILKTILGEKKNIKSPSHSINTPLGISRFINSLDGNEEIIIFELGEYYPGDISKLANLVKPNIGIITGINDAHLSKFKSINKTIDTIYEIVDYLKNKPVYINSESKLAKENARGNYIFYNKKGCGEWKVGNIRTSLEGTSFELEHINNKLKIEAHTKLLGEHQAGPLVLATNIAHQQGLTTKEIKKGIKISKPFSHRLELKKILKNIDLIDDSYNGNPDGVKAAINFLENIEGKRRFYITPGLVEMGENTKKIHNNIGEWLSKAKIEKVVLIENSVTLYIERGLRENNFQGEIIKFNDMKQLITVIPHITIKNDLLLIQNDWPDQYY